ncbi:MAG: glycosyltransferase [Candidatus Omnitrophota bacterium]
MKPLVSIVVPCYNHEKYVEKCIESIYSQTYTNFELFVFDDGSTDRSAEIIEKLKQKYGFYFESNENQGLANTLNRGYGELANGDFLTFCASDDYWVPRKLELQVHFFKNNPEYMMVFGKAIYIDEEGRILNKVTELNANSYRGGSIFKELFFKEFHPPVNYMFRKEVFDKVGFYDTDLWAEDFDMNLRIARHFKIGFINEFLMYYRACINSNKKMLSFKAINSHLKSINKYKDHAFYDKAISLWRYRNYRWYVQYRSAKLFALKYMLLSSKYLFSDTKNFLRSFRVFLLNWN